MIKPIWLDRAYVIENALTTSELSDIGEMSVSEETNIVASPYRSYVDVHPNRLNHFQPVLDRLEIKPSLLDIGEQTLLVEGKSDYAILTRLLKDQKIPFKIVPAHGATTLGALIGLLRGWNWRFVVLFDSDAEGKSAAKKYSTEFMIENEIIGLASFDPNLKEIESFLTPADLKLVAITLSTGEKTPTKKQIYQFFTSAWSDAHQMEAKAAVGLQALVEYVSKRLQ